MTIEATFRVFDRHDADGWSANGDVITDSEKLNHIRSAFSRFRVLLLKHWHYRGSRAPTLRVFEDFDELFEYLKQEGVAGDAVDVYDITDRIRAENLLVGGKYPDETETIPARGAY